MQESLLRYYDQRILLTKNKNHKLTISLLTLFNLILHT